MTIRTTPFRLFGIAAAAGLLASCSEAPAPTELDDSLLPTAEAKTQDQVGALYSINDQLEAEGAEYRLAVAEFYTESDEVGQTIFFNDRGNKQLAVDFLPGDPRRAHFLDSDPNTIDTWIDVSQGATASGLSAAQTTSAITAAMGTWGAAQCSSLLGLITPVAADLGVVQRSLGLGGGAWVPDLMHAGWLPRTFFDILAGGPNSILGVTFTFVWNTDLNGDGESEVAFREIYYNDRYRWTDGSFPGVDVETVALHEAGHGLSQAHFGKLFRTDANGKFHFAPRAVMNAGYTGPQRALAGTDGAGHCSLWGSWPSN